MYQVSIVITVMLMLLLSLHYTIANAINMIPLHLLLLWCYWGVSLAKWSSVVPPTSTTWDQFPGCVCWLRFADPNLTLMVFLWVLQFSFLCKFDFHVRQDLSLRAIKHYPLARKNGQPFPSHLTLYKVFIYIYLYTVFMALCLFVVFKGLKNLRDLFVFLISFPFF